MLVVELEGRVAGYHTVVQGEHVAGIAASYGFSNYQTVWNHPNNSDLKGQRQNPNVLFPGDSLFIPDREQKTYDKPTDNKHQFIKKGSKLKLRVKLEDQYEHPIANAQCSLTLDTGAQQVTTDASGKIEVEIPATTKTGSLLIQDDEETPYGNVSIPIKIGSLDPVEEVSGQQGRLASLGYFWGAIDGQTGPDFQSALEEFQCDQEIAVDGICGPVTQAKLKQVHGC